MEQRFPLLKKFALLLRDEITACAFLCILSTAVFLIVFLNPAGDTTSAQEFRTGPDVSISGDLEIGENSFGHRTYAGTVQNNLTWRVDYVRVEFNLYNKAGRLLLRKDIFVDGSTYTFQDGSVSHSTIEAEKQAAFICLTPIDADSIAKFEHTVYWMEYDSLPKQAF